MPTSLLDLDTWRAGTMMSVTTCQYPSIYLSIYLSICLSIYLSIYHHLLAPDYDVHNYMSVSIYLLEWVAISFSRGSSRPGDRTRVSCIAGRHFTSWATRESPIYAATAATKSLQSCPTLCDPIDSSPPGSPVPGILQARILEWVAIFFSSAWKWKVKMKSLSRVWLLATPWASAYQAPLSMGFSRQKYWSGVPLPSPYLSTHLSIYHHLLAPDYDVHNYMSIYIYLSTYLSTHLSIYHHLLAPWGDIINVREKKGCPCHLTPVCWTKDSILHIEAERSILKDRRRAGWGRMEKGEWNGKKKEE